MYRQLKILEFALSALLRNKYKNLALVAVYAGTVAVVGSVLFLTQALKAEATAGLASAPEIVVQRVSAGRHETIPLHYRDKIRDLPGVQAVTPRVWGYYYDTLIKANLTLMGVNDAAGELDLLRGRLPAQALECAVGRGLVSAFGAELGDLLALEDSRGETLAYRIVGVFNAQSNLLTNDLVVLTEKSLREFFAQDASLATDLVVRVYNPREVKTVAKKIKYLLPDTRPITRDEIIHTYATLFNWRSGMMLAVSVAALIAFCILAWDKAMGLSREEKRQIAVLKALGWETADVLAVKLWEGSAVSVVALLLGLLAAWVHVFVFSAPALTPLLKGWSVLFPAYKLSPGVDLYQLLVLAMLTVMPYLAATVIPAWKTAITAPDQVMKG